MKNMFSGSLKEVNNRYDELLRTDTLNTETEEDFVVIYKNDKNGNQLATVNRYDIPSEKKDSIIYNGELDVEHCSSWSFSKDETEVIGEEDEAQTISTSYSKELNPAEYQPEVNTEDYYNQFNDAVLSETITKTVTDDEGDTLSQTSMTVRGENRLETVATYESGDFGRTVQENDCYEKISGREVVSCL